MKLIKTREIQSLIIELRGRRVILDLDLAEIYCVSPKRLREQVRRNKERFPQDFMFQLTENEKQEVAAFCGNLKQLKYSPKPPYAFTRNGANMLSAILRSPRAIYRSIQIMRAFSVLEEVLGKRKAMMSRSPNVLGKLSTHSRAIMHLFQKDKIKTKEIDKIRKVINEMIGLLQKIVAESL
ncbi:MAG: ORF6N domain-containing protein [Candidatus Margulisbacteria bacterium]|nr:ORF6N domain-containing protein [Candidatus Margulisiibacteriota bacterium]